jgi:hypothetical protein
MKTSIVTRSLWLLVAVATSIVLFNSNTSAQRVRLRSQLTPQCNVVTGNANWKFSDIYADGNLAVLGSYNCRGAFIFNISNPDAPTLASWYNPGNNQQFLEAIVLGNRGYFGSGNGGGVHIVDLTDPANPVLLGTVDSTHGGGHNSIHEMMVVDQGSSRYLIENFNSTSILPVRVIDITNPAAPVFKWAFQAGDSGWIHAYHIRGNRLFTSEYTGAKVEIYDISSLATQAPQLIGSITSNTTNHSSWTSEDGNYLYSARETLDGDIRVYDIHNPAQPVLVRAIKAADLGLNAITPHNPVVMGNKLYVSWYQAGLQVFDLSDPTNPQRVGQYDTFPTTFAPTEAQRDALLQADPWDLVCGIGGLANALPSNYDGNWAVFPFLGENKVVVGDLATGLSIVDVSKATAPQRNVVSDFDGDRKTDLSLFTPSTGLWSIEQSSDSAQTSVNWGLPEDIPTAGDYDGDGKVDEAIFRPSTGTWWIIMSSTGSRPAVRFGLPGDIPVAADWDADGKTDFAVFRPANGVWYIQQSSLGFTARQWGLNGDKPVVGDFEGDGKPDIAVFRPSNGVWYILPSSSSIPIYANWGISTDLPVSGDFDGDSKTDVAVYRPSTGDWYVLRSSNASYFVLHFGLAEDEPIPADYDGDGISDIAVFRPSANIWYRLSSATGAFFARVFGQSGDIPSPSSVQPR